MLISHWDLTASGLGHLYMLRFPLNALSYQKCYATLSNSDCSHLFIFYVIFSGEVPGGGTTPGQPGGTTPGGPTKPTDVGDKEKEKGGDKVSKNQGVNPAGGNTNKETENEGTNTGPIQPVNPSDDDDKDDHVHGGIQGNNQ